MKELISPKLRTVVKTKPPYPLNEFPNDFPFLLGKEIIYLLSTKGKPELEGKDWENIFALCIGAEWKPSNVGLDDIVKGDTAWGAKTVKTKNPSNQQLIRLISGRNSPIYSFGSHIDTNDEPNSVGSNILKIWNERVSSIREKYKNLRTVVLIKSNDLSENVVFEFDTVRFNLDLYSWKWNKRKNLEGYEKFSGEHYFTWQPHGSQFTIIEKVPPKKLIIKIKLPPVIDKEIILKLIGFEKSWITVVKNG